MNVKKISTARTVIEKYFNLNMEKNTRKMQYVMARQFYYFYLRKECGLMYREIQFCLPNLGQDHSTIIHALRAFKILSESEKGYYRLYESVTELINRSLGVMAENEFSYAFNPS